MPLGMTCLFWGAAESNHALEGLLGFFIKPEVTWLLATGIIGYGIVVWFRLKSLLRGASQGIARAKGNLNRFKTPQEFTAKSAEIYRDLKANPIIGPDWRTFCDHLIPPAEEGGVIRRTGQPEHYFNENLLGRAGINLRFYTAFSGYLLGLGLLCTFFGLVAALYVASLAMDESPEKLVAILQSLLAAASFKFINSIAGLGSSMLFSWQLRHLTHEFQLQTDDFCLTVSELIPCVTAEILLSEGAESRREQTAAMRRLPKEMAAALESTLSVNLVKLVDPIGDRIGGIAEKITQLSQEAVRDMVKEFRAQLVAAAAEEIGELLGGLEKTRHSIERMGEQIVASAKHFETEMSGAAKHVFERMAAGAGSVEQSFRSTALQLEGSLTPLASQILALNESFLKMDQKMKHHLDLFTGSMDGLRGVLADFGTTADRLGQASAPLTNASKELFEMSRRIQESNEATVHALAQLSSFSQSLSDTTQQTKATWDAYRDRFEKVDDDLKGMVEQLGNGFTRYHEMVDGFIRQLDQSLAKSTQALGASIVELNVTLEKIEARR